MLLSLMVSGVGRHLCVKQEGDKHNFKVITLKGQTCKKLKENYVTASNKHKI